MSTISDLGEKILSAQAQLGLPNPMHYRNGLSEPELQRLQFFRDVPYHSELHDLYAWKNGVVEQDLILGHLWITPGFYLLSAENSARESSYAISHLDDWSESWFPILTDSAGARRFIDLKAISKQQVPIFYYEPDSLPVFGQIYDGIERMLSTLLECYVQSIYTVATGYLRTDFPREVNLSREMNPASSYWRRNDLY